jgi:hypothetical protein
MSQPTQIFDGGESPLAARVTATSGVSQIGPAQGSTQSDAGPAPNPANGPSTPPSGASSDPPYGGVVRARKS